MHLFDLIHEMYEDKTLSLMVKDKQVADLQFEYIFRYGIFGYGYSHELEQNDIYISNAMKESMFFKRQYPLFPYFFVIILCCPLDLSATSNGNRYLTPLAI